MKRVLEFGVLFAVLLHAINGISQEKPADDLTAIAPFINDQTVAIARIDLAQLDLAALQKQLIEPLLQIDAERISATLLTDKVHQLGEQLRATGDRRIYFVVSLAPMPNLQVSQYQLVMPPTTFVVVPAQKGLRSTRLISS